MVTATQVEVVPVGLGEIRTSRNVAQVLTAFGLGSCVAVCAYDKSSGVGAMAHIVLPDTDNRGSRDGMAGKYAESGVPALITSMERMGARRMRIEVKIAGGSRIVPVAGFSDRFEIGDRNVRAVKTALAREGVRLMAEDTGGRRGRTVQLVVSNGTVTVRETGGEAKSL